MTSTAGSWCESVVGQDLHGSDVSQVFLLTDPHDSSSDRIPMQGIGAGRLGQTQFQSILGVVTVEVTELR